MSLTLNINNHIAYVTFDNPDSKVNVLTSDVLRKFESLLDEVKAKPDLKALVITSKKKDVFIAGADIKEIEGITEIKDGIAKSSAGQEILNKLEDLSIPTVAVIDGVALGGGCELALACRYRISTFNDKVRIGTPEVNLGFVPGFGGTYRMPRLLGLAEGMKMVVSGKPIKAQAALKIGLVDRLYPQVNLERSVAEFVDEVAGKRGRVIHRKAKKGLPGFLDSSLVGHQLIFRETEKSILKTTKGVYPAPLKALAVIKKTFYTDRKTALDVEARSFAELAVTDISKNLVHVFYLTERFKKLMPPGNENVAPLPVRKCGVLGAGIMGGGIAQILSVNDIPARLKDVNYEAIAKGFQAAGKVYKQAVQKRRLKPHEASRKMGYITGTLDYSGFSSADMVIEAVVEKMEVKKKVFKELSANVPPRTILATNTSALSVTEMAKEAKDPGRVIGLHFFNPVHRMPLVEIITTPMTSAETIVTTLALAKKLGKTPILVKDSAGFLVNRILLSYINEAGRILDEGGDIEQIDRVMTKFGMPMGPFELSDEVGLDVGTKVLHILEDAFGERFKPSEIFEKVTAKGLLGKKSGKGFYIHGKKRTVNPEVVSLVPRKSSTADPNEWKHRMVMTMVNEAAGCLQDKIIDDAGVVDVGMIMGTGFPPFRGGLLKYADHMGIDDCVDMLNRFAGKYASARFNPSEYLLRLKKENKKFYS